VILQKENDCKKSLSQQEKNPQKEGKEEQGSKGKEVKPHLPIQGHEKLHEKKRMRNSIQMEETLKESENGYHISLLCKI
jgi:hypothetical protein